jgi:hypothetical protein
MVLGPGQDVDAAPREVHAKGEGLGVGVGVTRELPPPDEPHAAKKIAIATIAATLMPAIVVEDRASSHRRRARVSGATGPQ